MCRAAWTRLHLHEYLHCHFSPLSAALLGVVSVMLFETCGFACFKDCFVVALAAASWTLGEVSSFQLNLHIPLTTFFCDPHRFILKNKSVCVCSLFYSYAHFVTITCFKSFRCGLYCHIFGFHKNASSLFSNQFLKREIECESSEMQELSY